MLKSIKPKLLTLKPLPASVRFFLRPMVFLALGLHALLLFYPLQREQKPKPKKEEKEAVKITQLAKAPSPRPPARRQVPRVKRAPSNVPKPPTPAAKPDGGGTNQKDPFADFPHYPSSTPDCFGQGLGDYCRIANTDINTLLAHFKQALPGKKYEFAIAEDGASRKILQITKADRQVYLSLLADAPTSVYVLAPQPVQSLEALRGAVIVPSAFYDLLSQIIPPPDPNDPSATSIARRENFAQPDLFFKPSDDPDAVPDKRPNLDNTPQIIAGQTPESLYQTIAPQLTSIFEQVTPVGNFAGGPLYRLKKGSTTVFLSIVPSQGVSGAIITMWLKDPR